MSAIADFILVGQNHLKELREAAVPRKGWFGKTKDRYFDVLGSRGTKLTAYDWSGYFFATLLPYLDEKGIHIMKSEFDELSTFLTDARCATTFILTDQHKRDYLTKLDPKDYDKDTLRKYYEEFNETEEPEAGQAMLDAITVLQENLRQLEPSKVIILGIG